MNISEFLQLDINVRAEIAWNGVFIADKYEEGNSIQLYRIEDFFAEICYNLIDEEIITVNPLKNPPVLNDYSELVDISSLLV